MYAAAGSVLAVSGGTAHADSGAEGTANNSPGVLSGNTIQVPIELPINLCGNTATLIGGLNPVAGIECVNEDGSPRPTDPEEKEREPEEPVTPEEVDEPTPQAPQEEEVEAEEVRQAVSVPDDTGPAEAEEAPQLAETGGGVPTGLVVPLAGGLVLGGGALLYRRSRATQRA